jgi:hypothetical protein
MVECLVKTSGCYVGVFDLSSPVCDEGETLKDIFDRGAGQAREAGHEWAAILFINDILAEKARRREAVIWVLLFDGLFKMRISVAPEPAGEIPRKVEPREFLGGQDELVCPSGRLAVASLHEMRDLQRTPAIEVEPGRYRVRLTENEEEYWKHVSIEEAVMDYPPGEGPDWFLTLEKVG